MHFNHNQLQRVMAQKFYNGAELAEEIGVSRQTVYRWLRGELTPSTKNQKKICETLGVDADYFFTEFDF